MADKKLAGLKGQRNNLQANARNELKRGTECFPQDGQVDLTKAETCLFKLRSYLEQHQQMSSSIAVLTAAGELDAECEAASEFQELILDGVAQLTVSVNRLRSPPPPTPLSAPAVDFPGSSTAPSLASVWPAVPPGQNVPDLAVKLPKLQLDKFDGDPIKWEEFWDGFNNTIHKNDKLSKVDKFKYLKSYLESDALRMLSGYQLTTANYDTAVEALQKRFGNKDIAINAHFEALLALPEASHNTASLQTTYQSCETHIRSLVALGLSENVFGQVFTPIILSKMPKFVRMEIHRENKGETWTLTNLRDLLQQEILVREMSDRTVSLQPKAAGETHQNPKQGQRDNSKKPKGGTTAALVNGATSQSGKRPPIKCAFCQESHYSEACQKFPDVGSRREKTKGSCFICFRPGHTVRDCRIKAKKCFHCQKTGHHRSLCWEKFGGSKDGNASGMRNPESSLITSLNADTPEFVSVHYAPSSDRRHRAVLQTAAADIVGSKGTVRARLLFDTASSRTFVKTSVSRRVGTAHLGEEYLNIAGFAATKRTCAPYKKVSLNVLCSDGTTVSLEAFETATISCAIPKIAVDSEKFPILKQVQLAEPQLKKSEDVSIDILVGCDFYYDIIGSTRMPVAKGLYLIESKLGFVLSGRLPSAEEQDEKISSLLLTENSHLGSQPLLDLSKYWDLEEIGIKDCTDQIDDDAAMQQFMNTVRMKDNRYSVAWPWKQDRSVLTNNFGLAFGQLKSLLRRLKSNPVLFETYDKSIKDQDKQGIIEPAESQSDATVHYMPHHAVVRPDKETTKVRIVYNASAKSRKEDYSLNECLFRGPVLLEDMCGILIRFRFWPVALSSDIEKAFLQIELQESERDVVRFLWVKDPDKAPTNENLLTYRFCRVPFGVVSSPFLLAATVRHHMLKADTEVSRDIAGNIYVDNNISGCESAQKALEYYQEAKELFQSCSMNLREWSTNNNQFRDTIADKDRAPCSNPKVLGLKWDTKADTLSCPAFSADTETSTTKRKLLQLIAKLYDPCGFFSAVTVTGKLLMQKAWVDGTGWDDPVTEDLRSRWMSYETDLLQLPSIPINRWYGSGIDNRQLLELHTFCDASKDAYAAVVYLRIQTSSEIKTTLVFAKSRVKPLKGNITIPRLELLAVVVGVRLTAFVAKELRQPIAKKILWSDSKCVLQWIPKKQIMPVFVENRLKEIRKHRDVSFSHVPTDLNPADLASRGCALDLVKDSPLWWFGPPFLQQSETQWPDFRVEIDNSTDEVPEDTNVAVTSASTRPSYNDLFIAIDRFSNVRKLVNTVAWVQRFCDNARRISDRKDPTIQPEEHNRAFLLLIKLRQTRHFGELWTKKPTPPIVNQLKLFKDNDGLIRSQGRLLHANMDDNAKMPVLLPSQDHLTKLIVEDAHRSVAHAKTSHTLGYVRTRYWIPQGRSVVRKIVGQCRVCRRYDAKAFVPPEQPPLPAFRVTRNMPFQVVGMDYLGPLRIRVAGGTDKVWICIFTCSAVRAIHLEVVNNMTTAEFLLCLRRFVAIRGRPSLIISDNASQFRQADRTIRCWWKKLQEAEETRDWAARNQLSWKFVTEMAPWMGGFYERLVALVKNAFKKTLERRLVSMAELLTVTAEVASILNTRPLTYIGDDIDDGTLTPAHFLHPLRSEGFPTFQEMDPDYIAAGRQPNNLVLAWKHSQAFLDQFWKQWHNQYLLSLREPGKGSPRKPVNPDSPKVGSVVLIKEPIMPRGQWRLGRISCLHKSFDGQIRSATVTTQGQQLVRPLKLLIPLEIHNAQDTTNLGTAPPVDQKDKSTPSTFRPRRVAAANAAARIRRQLNDD